MTTSEALGAPGPTDSGLDALENLAHDIASQEAGDAINSGPPGIVAYLVAKGVSPADIYEAVRSPTERV